MAQSATTQAGLDASISSLVQTLLDDATVNDICKTLGIARPDGWIDDTSETWAYLGADSPTFTFTVVGDVTGKYSPGMRVKLTQTTVKYFIITAVSSYSGGFTTITVYGGTDYTLTNAAISEMCHSEFKAPFGFPLDPAKWTVTTTGTGNNYAKASPTSSVWYGDTGLSPTGLNISIPIGCWDVEFSTHARATRAAGGSLDPNIALSTSPSSRSDSELACYCFATGQTTLDTHVSKRKRLTLAAKTTYYLIATVSAGTVTNVGYNANDVPTIIKAVCAYL